MKDLIEAILNGLTSYIPLLAKVVSDPRRNVPRLVHEPSDPLRHALVFVGISLAISFAVQAPLLNEQQEFTTIAGALLMVKLFEVLAFNACLMLLFRLIGGTGTFEQTLTVSLYISGPIYIFVVFAQIIGIGLLAGTDNAIARDIRYGTMNFASQRWVDFTLAHSTEAIALTVLALITFVAVIAWYLYCWQIYRVLHGLSRIRSALSYVIAFAMFLGVGALRVLTVRGLNDGLLPGIN